MTAPHFQVHFAIKDIPCLEWNRLVASHGLYFTHEWQRYNEHFLSLTGRHPYVFSLWQGERLLALTCGYSPDVSSPMYYPPNVLFSQDFLRLTTYDAEEWEPIERIVHQLDPSAVNLKGQAALERMYRRFEQDLNPCLVLSCAFTSTIILDPTLSPVEQNACRDVMLDRIETYARNNGFRSVAFLYGLEEEVEILQRYGFLSSRLTALAYLDVSGMDHFDDYVQSLPKKRRNIVRREVKSFLAQGFQQQYQLLSDAADEIAIVEFNHLHKYNKARPILGIYEEKLMLAELFGESIRVLTLRQDDLLAASGIYLTHGDSLYVMSIGFDYEITKGSFSYPNLVFYNPIRYAIQHNISRIEIGPEAFEAKVLRCAKFDMRHCSFLAFTPSGFELLNAWLPVLHRRQNQYFSRLFTHKSSVATE